MKYLNVNLIKKLFCKRDYRESKLVEEVDGFKEWQKKYQLSDIPFEIASRIFKPEKYSLYRDVNIEAYRDIDPHQGSIKSLAPVAEISSFESCYLIDVLHPIAYEDSKKIAEELAVRTKKKISLKTTYRRTNL